MAESRRAEVGGGLYERLLQRLALALQEADTATRLHQAPPDELELSGLTPAELELIRAYLDRDLNWLRGWHAAAEELALIEQLPAASKPVSKLPARAASKPLPRGKPMIKKRQQLCCALCGTVARVQRGEGVLPCSACGSKLFRAGQPR
ncbi:hypothetical protein [Aquipseudomonas alcaligenes]|jgi:hypothetical protein|uniref:Uncharacterized protein n=1 Tax=Aquipseudomonas alcaligenes (strain ATCC 14909 / DSM 50342 / CCUG 1425 / JCM 20561 / NBRC 14159 / NCIMB 9945 / NCTC 10367 / 1577) TaxID=1215092 RepID=U3BAD4_AQUA1|nr:hypothetical protein [Pseudomonas alcaligenes]AMR65800.1 hypothetical protein A0T30_05180 [Pseudomonas alcaligenes]MEE1950601.1 hypothetical protein [Pseudomonas alcaligenes]GAD63773.1 hypothetical protein PA6_028_00880 [Pseudomonas alcaligenes NBRC 14159]SUD13908.1 Uncharacterised protein [Pseudomonas alcaligenes]